MLLIAAEIAQKILEVAERRAQLGVPAETGEKLAMTVCGYLGSVGWSRRKGRGGDPVGVVIGKRDASGRRASTLIAVFACDGKTGRLLNRFGAVPRTMLAPVNLPAVGRWYRR